MSEENNTAVATGSPVNANNDPAPSPAPGGESPAPANGENKGGDGQSAVASAVASDGKTTDGANGADNGKSAVAQAVADDENNGGKNADDNGGAGKKDDTGNNANQTPQVDYAKDLKVPDGVKLDEKQFGKACEIFKEMNLPKESAQKLLDFSLEMQKSQAVAAAEEKKRVLDNCKNAISKREKFNEEVPLVSAFVRELQKDAKTAPIADFLCDGVFGNLPEVWELTVFCARQMATEGRLVAGGKGSGKDEMPLPSRMYPSMQK